MRSDTYEMTWVETGGSSSTQGADIAGGARDVSQDGTENNHLPQVRTRGPFVNLLTQADDYECCLPSIVLLCEIVFHVRAVEMNERNTANAKKGRSGQEVGLLSSWLVIARMTLVWSASCHG